MRRFWFGLFSVGLLYAQDRAVIRAVKGGVTVQHASGTSSAAVAGNTLDSGDVLSVGPKSWAEIQLDSANHFRAGAGTEFAVAEAAARKYRLRITIGAMDYQVDGYTATQVIVETPSVSIRPLLNGIYRFGVDQKAQSQIVALSGGDLEVFAPTGTEWLAPGRKMIARGPADNPEFRIGSAITLWRRLAILASNMSQISAAIGSGSEESSASSESSGSGSKPAPATHEGSKAGSGSPKANSDTGSRANTGASRGK